MNSIQLSQKHGVNPALMQCFYCMKDVGVALMGRINALSAKAMREAGLLHDRDSEDPEAPRKVCLDKRPCNECAEYMRQGIIFISVDESRSDDKQNPYRSGGWAVVSEAFVRRMVTPSELASTILKQRVAFLPDDAWDVLGLPR